MSQPPGFQSGSSRPAAWLALRAAIDRSLLHAQAVGDAEGNRQVGAHVEKLVLDPLESRAQAVGKGWHGEDDSDGRVELVDGAECADPAVELGYPGAVAERRL